MSTPELPNFPELPHFNHLYELRPLMEAMVGIQRHPGMDSAVDVPVDLVLKAFQYAEALPDNPMALLPVYLICHMVVRSSPNPKFKSACMNSPEFTRLIDKFAKYLV